MSCSASAPCCAGRGSSGGGSQRRSTRPTPFGHVKTENPHLLAIADPAVLRAELDVIRSHYNGVRLHAGIGYVCPDDEHEGRGQTIRKARRPGSRGPDSDASPTIAPTARQHRPGDPAMLANQLGICDANPDTRQLNRALHIVALTQSRHEPRAVGISGTTQSRRQDTAYDEPCRRRCGTSAAALLQLRANPPRLPAPGPPPVSVLYAHRPDLLTLKG